MAGAVALDREIAPNLPPLWADELRVKQIMVNLLSNAVKFTPPGGRVTAGAAPAAGGGISLRVGDTGCGMTPAEQQKAFLPYRQCSGDKSRRQQGTGLGLPLTRALAEAHGAELRLDSAPGAGTVVTVTFPPIRVRPG